MPGQSRVAQPVSPRQQLDPAPTNPYPARPTRLRLKATGDSIGGSPHVISFDTIIEDIGFNYTAPLTDISFPRKGLWLVYAQVLLPNTGVYSFGFPEVTGTGTMDAWLGGFNVPIPPPAPSPGSSAHVGITEFHIDIAAGNTVTFNVHVQSSSLPGGPAVDAVLNVERISYGGTAALV